MNRMFAALLVLLLVGLPLSTVFSQDGSKEYKIETMDQNDSWVLVEKRARIGAGTTNYYLHKDKIISIELRYPSDVTITMEEKVQYDLEFVSNSVASQFVRDLVANL
ncbi:hypothetical protein KQI52_11770 [bacterium]|nr:hypothetical protein [bacterium]